MQTSCPCAANLCPAHVLALGTSEQLCPGVRVQVLHEGSATGLRGVCEVGLGAPRTGCEDLLLLVPVWMDGNVQSAWLKKSLQRILIIAQFNFHSGFNFCI